MPAPEFTLPTTGTSPKIATSGGLEAGINAVSKTLFDQIGAISTGLKPAGNWDASIGAFPSGAERGTYYVVNVAGTVDGAAFAIGDWLIPLVDGPETGTYADNWFRGDYSKVVPAKPDSAAAFEAGSDVSRGPGALWETKDGHRYEEVAAGGDLSNAAGVRLRVLSGSQGALVSGSFSGGLPDAVARGGTDGVGVNISENASLAAPLFVQANQSISGNGIGVTIVTLTSETARVDVAGYSSGGFAENFELRNFAVDGGDTAAYGVVLSDLERTAPTALAYSVYSGGGRLSDLLVTGCTEVGLHLGADSDDTQVTRVTSIKHRDTGTTADAVRIETPAHLVQCHFGNCTGYAVRSDRDVAGEMLGQTAAIMTPETLYTMTDSRINFGKKGLIYHNGTSDTGAAGAVAVYTGCFLENGGYAGTVAPYTDKEPVTESTLEPSAIHCANGILNINSPKKVLGGWTRSLFKVSGSGKLNVRLDGCEVGGSDSSGSRDIEMFVAGLEVGNEHQIAIDGPVNVEDISKFTTVSRVAPRIGGFPVAAKNVETIWEGDLSSTDGFTSVGLSGGAPLVTTVTGKTLASGSALTITGNGSGANSYLRKTLRAPEAAGRILLVQAAGLPVSAGATNNLRFQVKIEGSGMSKLASTFIPWEASDGYGDWVYHCDMGYCADATQDIELTVFCALAGASSDSLHVGKIRLLML